MKKLLILPTLLMSTMVWANPAPVDDISRTRGATTASVPAGTIEQRLESLERVVEARGNAQMRMQQQLQQLLDEVSELRGQTEMHSFQLEEIVQRQRDIYQEIERRMSGSVPGAANTAQPEASIEPIPTQYSTDVSENDAYDRAVQMVLRDRRYDAAINEFETFLRNYPNSMYAANANYWLGELVLRDSELSKAKTYFQRVVQNFADSNKAPDALFKLGQIAERENNTAAARQFYQQVTRDHANAPAARLAQGRLDSLN